MSSGPFPAEGHRPSGGAPASPAVRWAGTKAFLLDCGSLPEVTRWHAHLAAHPFPGQTDVLAAAATVLVSFVSARAARAAADAIDSVHPAASAEAQGKTVEIPVVYDGEDLAEVARLTGLSEQGVVDAHTGTAWTAAFGGFAPGFVYLVAPGDPLDVPRRDTPRTAVPAGSVALAGTFSAVYPRRSPGGWQLIGRTDAVLWDETRESPTLIRPGDTVRYRAVRELVSVADDDAAGAVIAPETAAPHALTVDHPGTQTLVQDLGRPGLGDLGVVASGATDRPSAAQANRLVGNPEDRAVLEVLLGGLSLTARGHHVLALAGAPVTATITDASGEHTRSAPFCAPFALYDGERLTLDTPVAGLRCYVAVRGGVDVPEVLGSRSSDVMSGIGPRPLAAGENLPVGAAPRRAVGLPEAPATPVPDGDGAVSLRISLGPRDDWFTAGSLAVLTGRTWRVGSDSNRVGVRFEEPAGGQRLERARPEELASEGVAAGSLQVPHSGVPVLFLADHPVTGGYPVIAVVAPEDLPLAAQLAPGAAVCFVRDDDAAEPPVRETSPSDTPSGDTA
ncbi:allophanate hydrolase [Kocuria varians]|uniref:Allophanate hydrolase n=1 Tax=Kocuria varians TaxID=1272 RepID=A0A4Y4D4D2_KOCVA|nr:5-oxoprolinase/urea amidolyase family protein [Kocuria varians]GED00059.1 allophanate hydrolase [Kocuria varians]